MDPDELKRFCINEINNLDPNDTEQSHIKADKILLKYLDQVAPELAEAYRTLDEQSDFWYG